MPIFTKDDKNFLFIHIPKTGGTSMEKIFFQSGWSVSLTDYGGKGSLNHLRHCSPQHMHNVLLQSLFKLDEFDEIFMIVRNPYDRFCSEYCWVNQLDFKSPYPIELWATEAFEAYSGDNYILDNHLRPQVEFRLPNTTIYKLEQGFDSIIQDLENRHQLKLSYDGVKVFTRDKISGYSADKATLNQATKELIYRQYSEDFRCFDYEA